MRFLLAAVLLGVALVGCSSAEPAAPPPAGAVAPASQPLALQGPQPRPARVAVPGVGIDGEVMLEGLGLEANGGHAEPPVGRPELASWYNLGPRPGAPGPAVILGHVNGRGQQGVFATLHQTQVGERILVTREDGSRVAFEAYRVQTIDKTAFPTDEVYGNTPGPEIRLITCGGELDRQRHRYLSNVIVYAKLVQ